MNRSEATVDPSRVGVSAYVPCFNNAGTIESAVASLRRQTTAPAQIFVVDDCSTDNSLDVCVRAGIEVVRHGQNRGRGAVRATAMQQAVNEFVACCDATITIDTGFIESGLRSFSDPRVAAVFGSLTDVNPKGTADRWRARHLFKTPSSIAAVHGASLITGATIFRASAVAAAGGFNPLLRHSEDSDLGERLLTMGYDVIFDPQLKAFTRVTNSVRKVLERYWRWHAGKHERADPFAYLRQISYSIKVMARLDLRDRDIAAIPLSLFSPHYQFWRSWLRRRRIHRQDHP